MAKLLIDFQLGSASVSNPDGSFNTNFYGSTVVNGPGNNSIGNFPNALDLGKAGKAICNISGLTTNFCHSVLMLCLMQPALLMPVRIS